MAASVIYPKAIENFNCTSASTEYINISFDIKENFNSGTQAYDSYYTYSYFIPKTGITMLLNLNNNEVYTEEFEVRAGNMQIAWRNGEYYDIDNGVILNVSDVYQLVSAVVLS